VTPASLHLEFGAPADTLGRTKCSCQAALNPGNSHAIRSAGLNQDDGPPHSVRMRICHTRTPREVSARTRRPRRGRSTGRPPTLAEARWRPSRQG
jgi:hypothetical protein